MQKENQDAMLSQELNRLKRFVPRQKKNFFVEMLDEHRREIRLLINSWCRVTAKEAFIIGRVTKNIDRHNLCERLNEVLPYINVTTKIDANADTNADANADTKVNRKPKPSLVLDELEKQIKPKDIPKFLEICGLKSTYLNDYKVLINN